MDDRHYLSDPRPLSDDPPTWLVDVYRKGVSEPLATLTINSKTLPPRYRKKKLIWKLPDSTDQSVNFGSEDRKRIWALFKEEKKQRRKSLKKLKDNGGETDTNTNGETNNGYVSSPTMSNGHGKNTESSQTGLPAFSQLTVAKDKEPVQVATNNNLQPEPTDNNIVPDAPPPTDNNITPQPPPGFANSLSEPPDAASQTETLTTTNVQPTQTAPPGFANDAPPPQDVRSSAYFSVAPDTLIPQIPMALARNFIDVYYPLLSQGNHELVNYFAPGFTKSLSVGDAHHFCLDPENVKIQISSLQDCQISLKGVVAQASYQNSVLILISGWIQLANQTAPTLYSHAVTLVPISGSQYQIHNDAMALFTND